MNKQTSLYLDLTRFIAAIIVFLWHFSYSKFTWDYLWTFYWHTAVIFFFVLSGYVISYVSKYKHDNFLHFIKSRISRFYSVIILVIIITFVFDFIWYYINPSIYINDYTKFFKLLKTIQI